MRGGYYRYSNGNLSTQSSYGNYWTRRLNNATDGYDLNFGFGNVGPQYSNSRGNGFALIEMVNTAFLERGAGKGPAKSEGRQAEESRQEKRPVPAGPSL